MENASKALIIAGAILLSILIIGLGMMIFQKAQGAMEGAGLDTEKVDAYNSKFEDYEGTCSGTNARALCDLVRSHNNANVDDPSRQIKLTNKGANQVTTKANESEITASEVNSIKDTIRAGKTYTVTLGYDAKSGYVVGIDITAKDSKTTPTTPTTSGN